MKEVANFANDKTDRLRETANKGGGGPKSRKFCERNKCMLPHRKGPSVSLCLYCYPLI